MTYTIPYPHKKVKIVGQTWTILVVPYNHKKLLKSWGITHFSERQIYISNRLYEKSFKWTLTHELLHAYFSELGFHTLLLEKLKKRQNERLVDSLAKELMPKLRPHVFKIKNYLLRKKSY